jgi:type IV pilus assembly protein PilE
MLNNGSQLDMKKKSMGFTLMELMIVVAILGILAALAYPQYVEYVSKGRRAECRSALLLASQKMEKFYSNNNQYPPNGATGLAAANINPNSNDLAAGASCTIALSGVVAPAAGGTAAQFLLTATANYTDKFCTSMTLNETATKGQFGPEPTRCWR